MAYHLLLVEILVEINQQDTPYLLFCPYTRNNYNSRSFWNDRIEKNEKGVEIRPALCGRYFLMPGIVLMIVIGALYIYFENPALNQLWHYVYLGIFVFFIYAFFHHKSLYIRFEREALVTNACGIFLKSIHVSKSEIKEIPRAEKGCSALIILVNDQKISFSDFNSRLLVQEAKKWMKRNPR